MISPLTPGVEELLVRAVHGLLYDVLQPPVGCAKFPRGIWETNGEIVRMKNIPSNILSGKLR